MNSEAGNTQLVAKSTLPHSPLPLLPAWAFSSSSARGKAACTGWGGRMGPAPGNTQGGWLVDRAVPASWFRRNCTARLTLCSVGWEVLTCHIQGGESFLLLSPTHPQAPRVQLAQPRNLGCGGLAWMALPRELKDLKGPVLWTSLWFHSNCPVSPGRTWLVGLHLPPHQHFPQSLGLNPGQEPL